MRWTRAKNEFKKKKQASRDYIALFSDAANIGQIYHIGVIASIEVSKTTTIEFSQIAQAENKIWICDLEKLSGGYISKNFIRPYSLCKTPDFNSFPKLKTLKSRASEEKQKYYAMEGVIVERIYNDRKRDRKLNRLKIDQHLKKNGNLNCEICGFSFENVYGLVGEKFCE